MLANASLRGNRAPARRKLLSCDVRRAKIIAVAFTKRQRTIAFATNQIFRGHSKIWTVHAECALVRKLHKLKAKERFGKIDVLVMRWSPRKQWTMARPCNNCLTKMRNYGIENIFFTNEIGKIAKM